YQATADDVFISTYPKCGTTWMQNVVWLMLNEGRPMPPSARLTELIPHLEEIGAEFVERLAPPRVIKTHLPFAMTPYHLNARYIYVARNPFDCAVSFYHHTRGFIKHYDFEDGTFAEYFRCFVRGEIDFGDYFENVLSWFGHRADDNVFFVTYEDMQTDLRSVVIRLAGFLGGKALHAVAQASTLEAILEHSGFTAMARDQQRWASERPANMPAFVRKGVVGDWENHFTSSQALQLLARLDESAESRALAALWPTVMERARQVAYGR
ncbi:MAG: sulfotransferase domain-containing protein, partial [Chromatiales bacterium]|nr:sulfotransferase domain-containing protein [Chromatiales bacterium]